MSFLFLIIKAALIICVIKFFWNVTIGLLASQSANKAVLQLPMMDDIRTVDATAKEVK